MLELKIEQIGSSKSFGGWTKMFSHHSETCGGEMKFSVYLPPQTSAALFLQSPIECCTPAHLISYPVLPSPKETLLAVTHPVKIIVIITKTVCVILLKTESIRECMGLKRHMIISVRDMKHMLHT